MKGIRVPLVRINTAMAVPVLNHLLSVCFRLQWMKVLRHLLRSNKPLCTQG
jgi:hypothetical protein